MSRENQTFKRAVILSVSIHLVLMVFAIISPHLPKGRNRGMVNYVPVRFIGGGGGGGSSSRSGGSPPPPSEKAESQLAETEVPVRESLRDLTTPQNLKQKPPDKTYPVEKPKRDRTPKTTKKTSIKKAPPKSTSSKKAPASKQGTSSGTGEGSGFQVGIGDGSGEGPGFGPGYGTPLSLTGFNYPWYLQTIMNQTSSNWLTAQIRSGVKEDVSVVVRFKIFRDGHISEPEIAQSSGLRTMDQSAIRAVRNSTFPPLPQDFEGEYIQINLIFRHTK